MATNVWLWTVAGAVPGILLQGPFGLAIGGIAGFLLGHARLLDDRLTALQKHLDATSTELTTRRLAGLACRSGQPDPDHAQRNRLLDKRSDVYLALGRFSIARIPHHLAAVVGCRSVRRWLPCLAIAGMGACSGLMPVNDDEIWPPPAMAGQGFPRRLSR